MEIIKGLYYSKDHEWVKVEGSKAYIGITDYAQNALGDIVFVELPEIDVQINKGDNFGAAESVKAASEIYSPVSGTVVEINETLEDEPELLNNSPYDNFIIAVNLSDASEIDELLSAEQYALFCDEE